MKKKRKKERKKEERGKKEMEKEVGERTCPGKFPKKLNMIWNIKNNFINVELGAGDGAILAEGPVDEMTDGGSFLES